MKEIMAEKKNNKLYNYTSEKKMKEILRCFRKRIKSVYLEMLGGENKSKWKPH